MSKISKEEQARREGMSYALRIAKERGIDGLEQDLKMRGALNCPVGLNKDAIDLFTVNVKNMVLDTTMILLADAMHVKAGYGRKRIQDMLDYISLKAECIGEDLATWKDYQEALKEETGLEMEIRFNDKDVKA